MQYMWNVPENKKIDLIIDTDAKNEADDQYVIAHALLSPKFNIKGLVAAHFSKRQFKDPMMASYQECLKMAGFLNYPGQKVFMGNRLPLDEDENEVSEGAQFIIDEAKRSEGKLYVAVLGPLSNVAAALLKDESIAEKLVVYYSGGRKEHSEGQIVLEANIKNDIKAFNVVISRCKELYMVPMEEYAKLSVSLAELEYKLKGKSRLCDYLFKELVAVSEEGRSFSFGESWILGDSSTLAALLNPRCCSFMKTGRYQVDSNGKAVKAEGEMTYLYDFDRRYILEDLFSKLALHAQASDNTV